MQHKVDRQLIYISCKKNYSREKFGSINSKRYFCKNNKLWNRIKTTSHKI